VTYLPAEERVPEEDEENQTGMMSELSDQVSFHLVFFVLCVIQKFMDWQR